MKVRDLFIRAAHNSAALDAMGKLAEQYASLANGPAMETAARLASANVDVSRITEQLKPKLPALNGLDSPAMIMHDFPMPEPDPVPGQLEQLTLDAARHNGELVTQLAALVEVTQQQLAESRRQTADAEREARHGRLTTWLGISIAVLFGLASAVVTIVVSS